MPSLVKRKGRRITDFKSKLDWAVKAESYLEDEVRYVIVEGYVRFSLENLCFDNVINIKLIITSLVPTDSTHNTDSRPSVRRGVFGFICPSSKHTTSISCKRLTRSCSNVSDTSYLTSFFLSDPPTSTTCLSFLL